MPICRELRPLYPPNWPELSQLVRFERAGGACQVCGRPHGERVRCLPDGRWFDQARNIWRDRRGRPARWPDLVEAMGMRTTLVVLAAAHLDHDPANNRLRNLRSLCQRCHILHDRPYHLAQRWITYRLRYALGDFFLGVYERRFGSLRWADVGCREAAAFQQQRQASFGRERITAAVAVPPSIRSARIVATPREDREDRARRPGL